MFRITAKIVREWVETWNKYNPDMPMGCTFSENFAAIGHLGEKGSIDVIARGETPREAWEGFSYWKAGYEYCEQRMKNL